MKTMLITLVWWMICLYTLAKIYTDKSPLKEDPKNTVSLLPILNSRSPK